MTIVMQIDSFYDFLLLMMYTLVVALLPQAIFYFYSTPNQETGNLPKTPAGKKVPTASADNKDEDKKDMKLKTTESAVQTNQIACVKGECEVKDESEADRSVVGEDATTTVESSESVQVDREPSLSEKVETNQDEELGLEQDKDEIEASEGLMKDKPAAFSENVADSLPTARSEPPTFHPHDEEHDDDQHSIGAEGETHQNDESYNQQANSIPTHTFVGNSKTHNTNMFLISVPATGDDDRKNSVSAEAGLVTNIYNYVTAETAHFKSISGETEINIRYPFPGTSEANRQMNDDEPPEPRKASKNDEEDFTPHDGNQPPPPPYSAMDGAGIDGRWRAKSFTNVDKNVNLRAKASKDGGKVRCAPIPHDVKKLVTRMVGSGRGPLRSFHCNICKKGGHPTIKCPEAECHACGLKGHMSSVCERPRCRHCGELGHLQKSCPVRRGGKSDANASAAGARVGQGAVSGSAGTSQGAGGDSRSDATGSVRSGGMQAGGPTRSFSDVARGVTVAEREERFVPDYARPERSLPLASRLYDMVHDMADFKAMAQPSYYDGLLQGIEARRQKLEERYRREMESLRAEREKVLRDKQEAELMAAPLKRMMDAVGELEKLCKKRRVESEAPATVSAPEVASEQDGCKGSSEEQMEIQENPVEGDTVTSVEVKRESPNAVEADKPADEQVHPPDDEVEQSKTAESREGTGVDVSVEEPALASSSCVGAQAGGSLLSEGSRPSWGDESEVFDLEKLMEAASGDESKEDKVS